MRILLTGCNGNLGSHLIKESTDHIVGLGRDEWRNVEDYFDDEIDTVIHTAYDLKSNINSNPEKYLQSNVLTTAKLLELAKKYNVRRFIFISSCAVYGNAINTQEDQLCAPISINGVVKLLNEKVIQEFCCNNRIKCEVYRLFNMYGGNDNFSIINHVKSALKNNQILKLNNNGTAQRDFIHVYDIAKIILRLMKLEHKYECVNIGTGVGTKIIDIVNSVKSTHADLKIENNVTDEVEVSIANIDRLHSLLNYNTINIDDYLSDV